MIRDAGWDGLDIDYEYPTDSTIQSFTNLLSALRSALDDLAGEMKTTPFWLSIAAPATEVAAPAYKNYLSSINDIVDTINSMSYDYVRLPCLSTS